MLYGQVKIMRHDIEIKYNAFSGNAYFYYAIKTKDRPIFASNIKDLSIVDVPDDKKGSLKAMTFSYLRTNWQIGLKRGFQLQQVGLSVIS